MRTVTTLILALFVLGLSALVAQTDNGAGDLFYKGFMLKSEAEKLEQAGDIRGAIEKFQQSQQAIAAVSQNFPAWQPEVVAYRLRLIEQSLTRLTQASAPMAPPSAPVAPSQVPIYGQPMVPAPGAPYPTLPAPGVVPAPTLPAPAPSGNLANPLEIINQTFNALQGQNNELKTKLNLYEDGYTNLLRERQKSQQDMELLKNQMRELSARAESMSQQAGAQDAEVMQELDKIRNETKMANEMLASRTKDLEESSKMIADLEGKNAGLTEELKKVTEQVDTAKKEGLKPDEMTKLMADNTRLKKELEVARGQVEALKTEGAKKDEEIASLRTQILGIQGEMTKLRQENTVYQGQVAELTVKLKELNTQLAAKPKDQKPSADDAKLADENKALRGIVVRQLRQQQRTLQAKELVMDEMKKTENTSKTLIENLEDMSKEKFKLSVEEESLFTEPELKEIFATDGRLYATLEAPSTTKAAETAKKEEAPKPEAKPAAPAKPSAEDIENELLVKAADALQKADYKAAGTVYQDVLRANPKNVLALTNLAGIRLQQRKYDEAEVLLQKCLFYAPDNDAVNYRLGVCYFQQNKLNEALASFEKAAAKKKDNARTHHYLGIITSKQGNRTRAESEFTSALAIDPNYADAYFNLAVLYATGNPPDWTLARKNYQNALERGIKADPTLEKLLGQSGAAANRTKPENATASTAQ